MTQSPPPDPGPDFAAQMRRFQQDALARVEADRAVAERARTAARACRRSTDTGKALLPKLPPKTDA